MTDESARLEALQQYLRLVGDNCPSCGYDLSELTSPVCPECGTTIRIGVVRPPDYAAQLFSVITISTSLGFNGLLLATLTIIGQLDERYARVAAVGTLASLIALAVCLKSWSSVRRRSIAIRWLLATLWLILPLASLAMFIAEIR